MALARRCMQCKFNKKGKANFTARARRSAKHTQRTAKPLQSHTQHSPESDPDPKAQPFAKSRTQNYHAGQASQPTQPMDTERFKIDARQIYLHPSVEHLLHHRPSAPVSCKCTLCCSNARFANARPHFSEICGKYSAAPGKVCRRIANDF